jgi:hypothetical protein
MKQFFMKLNEELTFKQVFWAWSHPEQTPAADFTYYDGNHDLIKKMRAEPNTTRFVFHGMFSRKFLFQLLLSRFPKRSAWVCWGADLYQHKSDKPTIKAKFARWIHSLLVARLHSVFALNKGDGELIQQLLWKRPVTVLPYPLIGSDGISVELNDTFKTILVGNSGAPSNEHIEALSWLARFANSAIKVVVPLNYGGSPEYVEQVIKHGRALFSDKFLPITEMLDKNEYDKLLASVDVGVFAHYRQQGLYVVYSLFLRRKKMYIRSSTSSFESLIGSGFSVFASEDIVEQDFNVFTKLDSETADHNEKLMQFTYSETALLPKWRAELAQLFS